MSSSNKSEQPYLKIKNGRTLINVVISPGSKRDKIIGLYGERLKIAITAPPVDGKANAHLLKFLSKLLKCPKSHLEIEKGETSREKTISILGVGILNLL